MRKFLVKQVIDGVDKQYTVELPDHIDRAKLLAMSVKADAHANQVLEGVHVGRTVDVEEITEFPLTQSEEVH